MGKLLKGEVLKNKLGWWFAAAGLLPAAAAFFIKTQIADRVESYIAVTPDVYAFSVLSNIYLLFLLPCFTLIMFLSFGAAESKENGWIMVLSSVKKPERLLRAKCFAGGAVLLFSYLIYGCANLYFLRGRGAELILEVVLIPLVCSFLCFLPVAFLLLFVCMVFSGVTEKVFLGAAVILLNMFMMQTRYRGLYFPGFYYVVSQEGEGIAGMTLVQAVLAVLLFGLGVKGVKRGVREG